jgi:hypothetical protein
VLYVANFVTGPECIEGPPTTFICGQAIPPLDDGDIVVSWWKQIGRGVVLPDGPRIVIDGHEARLIIRGAGDRCAAADVEAYFAILTSVGHMEDVSFCSRGVDAQEAMAAFQRFVGSIDLATN